MTRYTPKLKYSERATKLIKTMKSFDFEAFEKYYIDRMSTVGDGFITEFIINQEK